MNHLIRIAKAAARTLLPWHGRRLVYRWLAQRYVDSLSPDVVPGRLTILLINHHYDQDIRALRLSNRDYNLVEVRADSLFRSAKIFFSDEVRRLTVKYPGDDSRLVERYRDECRRIFERLRSRFGLDLIVTASDVFYWIREFIKVAAQAGVKTVVLDKEGLRSPYGFREEALRVQRMAPYMSHHLCVWSERQRQFWNRVGVADDNITVIGQPRSDLLFRENGREVDGWFPRVQPLVTLFSYMDDAYIPPARSRDEGLSWRQMKQETHEEVRRLAEFFTNYNFVIKTHPQQPDHGDLERRYRLANLKVIGGAQVANELLKRSELIIAFQTTAVLEALYLGRHVIYTYWDPCLPRLEKELLPYHEAAGLVVARSVDEFSKLCRRRLEGDIAPFELTPEQRVARENFVGHFLHRPDGIVGERFFETIKRFLP